MAKRKTKSTSSNRNYARGQKTSRHRSHSRQAKSSSPIKWLIIGIMLGSIAAAGVYFYQTHTEFKHSVNSLLMRSKNHPQHTTKHVVKTKQPPAPQFSFYTMLKNQKTIVHKTEPPHQSQQPVVLQPQHQLTHTAKAKQSNNYYLQVASFHKQQDADHIKAKLTLMGFNVTVTKIQANANTWYRVIVGPYQSQTVAESEQKRLSANKIKSFLRRTAA